MHPLVQRPIKGRDSDIAGFILRGSQAAAQLCCRIGVKITNSDRHAVTGIFQTIGGCRYVIVILVFSRQHQIIRIQTNTTVDLGRSIHIRLPHGCRHCQLIGVSSDYLKGCR